MAKSEKKLIIIPGSTGSGRKQIIKWGAEKYPNYAWLHYGDRLPLYLDDSEKESYKKGELIPSNTANHYFDEMVRSAPSNKIVVSGFGINHEEMVHILTDYEVERVFLLIPLEHEQLSRLLDSMKARHPDLKRPLNVLLKKMLYFESQIPLIREMCSLTGTPVIDTEGTLEKMFATIEANI